MNQQTETDTHFAWQQQQQQLFYGPLSGTVRVSWYQKKYSPTHHPNHHAIFISFFHLPRSVASSLFKLRAWQSFAQPLSMCSLVYDLVCSPPPHIPYSLYLLPLAPKNLHPLPLHYVSWIWATSLLYPPALPPVHLPFSSVNQRSRHRSKIPTFSFPSGHHEHNPLP